MFYTMPCAQQWSLWTTTQFPLGKSVVNASATMLWPKTYFWNYHCLSNMTKFRYRMICPSTFWCDFLFVLFWLFYPGYLKLSNKGKYFNLSVFSVVFLLSAYSRSVVLISTVAPSSTLAFLRKMCSFQQTSSHLPLTALLGCYHLPWLDISLLVLWSLLLIPGLCLKEVLAQVPKRIKTTHEHGISKSQ